MGQTIKSPLPGTFYRRPNPEANPFVNEGDAVKQGDVVGLIEIMKNFYDVTSDADGIVTSFLVENEALVEAGQDLIALDAA
jgi:acetyl-CoA carboxylase biotin carboxyl carrier protein